MCEKRTKRIIKKGSQKTRLREARRLERIHRLASPTLVEETRPVPKITEQEAKNRALIELAYKTMALMQKNKLIQEEINSLKKETSEFVAVVMSDPENRRRYLDNLRLYGSQVLQAQQSLRLQTALPLSLPIKLEKA